MTYRLFPGAGNAFYFEAQVKVKFNPFNYQQMAGLTNDYNDRHWSFVFITWNEINDSEYTSTSGSVRKSGGKLYL